MIDPPIELVAHRPLWHDIFLQEKLAIEQILKGKLQGPIKHIGSTAVPDLVAKPTIDIMVGVDSLITSKFMIEILANLNYCYAPYKTQQMHWFCKPSPANRQFHLHLVPFNSQLWQDRLFFRDKLRQSAKVREQYQQLKQSLAKQYVNDRDGYSSAKSQFIKQVLAMKNYCSDEYSG